MAIKRDPLPKLVEEEVEEIEEEEDNESEGDDDEDEDEEDEDEDEDDEEAADEDDYENSRESIRKLLEPFGKDQLIDLLKDAALKDPALLTRISGTPAPVDPSLRKIFVHGLGWDATTEDLKAAFAPFGEIEDCRAVADRTTGRCKGFGFVLFRSLPAARKALKEPQKKIGQRMTSCQLASLGPPSQSAAAPAGQGLFTQPAMGLIGQGLGMNGALGAYGSAALTNSTPPPPYGAGLGLGVGVNSVSPSVMGRYASSTVSQDYGTYQSDPYSSTRSQSHSGVGSMGSNLPPYYGRY